MSDPRRPGRPRKFVPATYHPTDDPLPANEAAARVAAETGSAALVAALSRYWRSQGREPVDYRRRA